MIKKFPRHSRLFRFLDDCLAVNALGKLMKKCQEGHGGNYLLITAIPSHYFRDRIMSRSHVNGYSIDIARHIDVNSWETRRYPDRFIYSPTSSSVFLINLHNTNLDRTLESFRGIRFTETLYSQYNDSHYEGLQEHILSLCRNYKYF